MEPSGVIINVGKVQQESKSNARITDSRESGPMQETGGGNKSRPEANLASVQVAVVGQNDTSLLIVDRDGILRRRMGKTIQSCIDARDNEKQADDQKG